MNPKWTNQTSSAFGIVLPVGSRHPGSGRSFAIASPQICGRQDSSGFWNAASRTIRF